MHPFGYASACDSAAMTCCDRMRKRPAGTIAGKTSGVGIQAGRGQAPTTVPVWRCRARRDSFCCGYLNLSVGWPGQIAEPCREGRDIPVDVAAPERLLG
jgi:hypothetical protein